MILLNVTRGTSVSQGGKVPLESMELTLKERETTARIVPARMDGITTESWLRDDTEPGNGIAYRVRSIEQDYGSNTPTVELEHVIMLLRDTVITQEITPETITGTEGATTCTAQQAINYLLGLQHTTDWVLNSMAAAYSSVTGGYKFSSGSIYDAIVKVTETLESPRWYFTTTQYPFKLNILQQGSGISSELKPGRNLTSLTKTIDRSGMYTRFYPVGADDLRVTGGYVSRNENLYGVISHTEVDQSLTTEAELTAWANERLNKHAHPNVTITADGLELQTAFGIARDKLEIGTKCRIPLVEFGETFEERIVELYYPDKVNQREVVRVTLANAQEDVTRIIADAIKHGSSGSAGMTSTRRSAADHAWFEDTDEYVAMVAQKTGINSLGQQETLYGKIQVEAGKITQIVSAVGENGEVTAASIVLAINNSTGLSEALISADKIILAGGTQDEDDLESWAGDAAAGTGVFAKFLTVKQLTAQEITTLLANIGSADISVLDADDMYCDQLVVDTSCTLGAAQMDSIELGSYSPFTDCIISATVNTSTNTLTLTKASGGTVTFSRAAASVSGSWGSGVFTVTGASNALSTSLTNTGHWGVEANGENVNYYYYKTYATINSGGTSYDTGNSTTINATSRYNGGWNDCIDACVQNYGLINFSDPFGGRSATLYLDGTLSAGTGVWRLGGQTTWLYAIPAKK